MSHQNSSKQLTGRSTTLNMMGENTETSNENYSAERQKFDDPRLEELFAQVLAKHATGVSGNQKLLVQRAFKAYCPRLKQRNSKYPSAMQTNDITLSNNSDAIPAQQQCTKPEWNSSTVSDYQQYSDARKRAKNGSERSKTEMDRYPVRPANASLRGSMTT